MNKRANILTVDDTSESLTLLMKILTPEGYQVRPADSGELALAAVDANPPDLILLDVRMKGMDGLEVCRRLKAREETRHIPIILISAFADVKDWVEGLRLGASDYITKPFQTEELLTRVKTHLTLRQATVSLEQQSAALRHSNEQLQSEIAERKQVEKALQESETRYKELFDNISSGVAIYTAKDNGNDFIFQDFNKAGEKLDGERRDDIIGKSILEVRPEIKKFGLFDVFKRVWATGVPEHFPETLYKDNRLSGWYDNYVYKLSSGEVVAVYNEVTDRKQAEESLQESEEKYRQLYESNQMPISIFDIETLKFLSVNNAFVEKYGYTKEEFLKMTILDIRPESEIEKLKASVKTTDNGLVNAGVYLHTKKNGEIIHVEIIRYDLVFEGKNAKLVFANDITERMQAEEALRESELKYRRVSENSPAVLYQFMMTPEGLTSFPYVSNVVETILGIPAEDIMKDQSKFIDIVHPDDQEIFKEGIMKSAEKLESFPLIFRCLKDGEVIFLEARGMPTPMTDGGILWDGFLIDITERKRAEEKLTSLLKEKEMLIKEVHHRVRNNFAIVSSLLNLQSRAIHDKQVKAMFLQSRDRINSMALLHRRLYLSQDLTHINFSEYIKTLAADLFKAYKIDPKKIFFIIEVDDIVLEADKVLPCGLIVNELISNALKHGFPESRTDKGRIKVSFFKINENEVELAVMDNGVGLPEDFDIEKSSTLGLQLVTLLAEDQLRGKLKVSGKGGAQFKIQFALQAPMK